MLLIYEDVKLGNSA